MHPSYSVLVYVGKSIDADELNAYRSANTDATFAWIKRSLVLGSSIAAAVLIFIGFSKITSGTKKITSN